MDAKLSKKIADYGRRSRGDQDYETSTAQDLPRIGPARVSISPWTICAGLWLFVLTSLPLWFVVYLMSK